ncbi:MAG: hypothetical protein RID09_19240 [Coleofasciculus sp. G1-WW12-02]
MIDIFVGHRRRWLAERFLISFARFSEEQSISRTLTIQLLQSGSSTV